MPCPRSTTAFSHGGDDLHHGSCQQNLTRPDQKKKADNLTRTGFSAGVPSSGIVVQSM